MIVPAHRLQRVADTWPQMAVVDEQARAAVAAMRSAMAAISAVRAGAISTIAPCGASAASTGSSVGSTEPAPAKKQRSSLSSSPTMRSRQPVPARTNWRTGTASNNSLPTMSSGCSGKVSIVSCQPNGERGRAKRLFLDFGQPRAGLDHGEGGAVGQSRSSRDKVRSISFISVPRPGPISAMVTGSGRPIASQAW